MEWTSYKVLGSPGAGGDLQSPCFMRGLPIRIFQMSLMKKRKRCGWELVYTRPSETSVLLGRGLALLTRLWCCPVEHKHFYITPTSDKATLTS